MTITSFNFLLLVGISAVIYYLVPARFQWHILLMTSLVFYHFVTEDYTIVFLVISALTAYITTNMIYKLRKQNRECASVCTTMAVGAIAINVVLWFVLKAQNLWMPIGQLFLRFLHISSPESVLTVNILAGLGMGYYTVQIIGYILDCYWGTAEPQKNPLKLFLFVCYYPQLTTGPISRYHQLQTLYEGHKFQYCNIARGSQRILWGFVKKLVLAERLAILIPELSNFHVYKGFDLWMAILLFPIQMYADFSGCMDIVLGVSEIYGISLPENFRNPFFARSSQEFWQRWHITLGTWAKDYILYPLLKSSFMQKLTKAAKKKFGKKTGKFIATAAGMFILWMVIGIWHGGIRYIVGVSLWYWFILMGAELLAPTFKKWNTKFGFRTDSFSWHLFQSARVYVTYAIGAVFFSKGIRNGLTLLKRAVLAYNPWVFFDERILSMGVSYTDINVMIVCVVLLFVVGVLREKYGYARNWVEKQCIFFRWFVWIALFMLVLIYGKYGQGYDAAQFIYQGF